MDYDIINKSTEFSRDFEVDPKIAEGIGMKSLLQKTMVFIDEEVQETKDAIEIEDLVEIIDGFGDITFLALNGIYKTFRMRGNSHELSVTLTNEVMQRICDANLSKKQLDGTILYKEGKVVKPKRFKPPSYDDII